ncbi:MAG TPA: PEGA domain-containing protein, partial [Kofleriaceae bacterium]|nr:PEGA domain-containing protein [Kofleriaceae bacterium]
EFGDEAPTELFGEVGGDEDQPTDDRMQPVGMMAVGGASGVEVADLNAEIPILGVHAAAQAAEAARVVQIAQAATISPSANMMAPDISSLGLPYAVPSFTPPGMYGGDPGYFGSTSNVTPLPKPVSDLDRLRAHKKRRPSVAKDVGIGIGIAAIVLGLFAGGKYMFFGDTPGTKEARGGTIAVALPGNEIAAEVWIDDQKVGVVEGDEPLTLDERPAGTYRVKVTRPGVQDCEKKIEVESGKPSIVTCTFVKEPETGLLVIEGLASDHTVFFDGQQISDEAAREPLKLTPGQEHSIVIKRGDEIVQELSPTGVAGRELRRVLVETSRATTTTEVLAADITPVPERVAPPSPEPPTRTASPSAKPDEPDDPPVRRSRPRTVDIGKRVPGDKPPGSSSNAEADDTQGYLIANTTPWARVWIDGKDTGRSTPIARRSKIKLAPGKHKVVFVVGNQKFPYSVVITAGETSKLVKDLVVKE